MIRGLERRLEVYLASSGATAPSRKNLANHLYFSSPGDISDREIINY